MRTTFYITTLVLGLTGCGDGKGPGIPEPVQSVSTPSGDAVGNSGGATPAPTPTPAEASDSTDQRLAALPASTRSSVLACEATAHIYDLGALTCTNQPPAPFACTINDEFKTRIDPSTIAPLEKYLQEKVKDMTIYSCTIEDKNVAVYFYKMENGKIVSKKLNIAKKS